MNEEWKEIPNTNGRYFVSNTGKIFSKVRNHLMAQRKNWKGYYICTYYPIPSKMQTLMVARTVAELFIPNPDGKPQVNHIDGNKLNNNVSNLEWVTCKENIQDSVRRGTHSSCKRKSMTVQQRNAESIKQKNRWASMSNDQKERIRECGRQHKLIQN